MSTIARLVRESEFDGDGITVTDCELNEPEDEEFQSLNRATVTSSDDNSIRAEEVGDE